jgi:hypothetical protein
MATSSEGGVRSRTRCRRRAEWVGIPTAALSVALALGACGGGSSSTVNANHWAGQVCSRIVTWSNELQSGRSNVVTGVNGSSPQQAKTQFVNFLNGAVMSTDTMIAGVQAAGVPSVPNGRAISNGLVSGLQQIRAAFAQAQNQAQALPADNPAALSSGAQNLANTLTAAGNQVKTNLNSLNQRYASSELSAAFKNQTACQSLTKS